MLSPESDDRSTFPGSGGRMVSDLRADCGKKVEICEGKEAGSD